MKIGYKSSRVIVCGGGVAGTCAAIASARQGVDTLLVERNGFIGGMFTGGNMVVLNSPPPCGIGKEIVDGLTREGYARRCPDDPPNYPVLHYDSEYCTFNVVYSQEMAKIALFQLVKKAGVKLLLHSYITGTIVQDGTIKGVIVENKSGKQFIQGDVIVDATSDGDVAALSGAPFRKGQTEKGLLFAMTSLVRLSHVDWPKISEYSKSDYGFEKAIRKASENGELPYYSARNSEMLNYWGHPRPELSHLLYEDEALLWGGTVTGVDGTNVDDLTRAEVESREQYMSEIRFLRKYIPGFKDARIECSSVSIGVRAARHVIGEYVLTGKDIIDQTTFPDVVAYNIKAGYPVNDIPYRCLVPKDVEGLLVSGNCISVMPGSTYMGPELGAFNNLKNIPAMWSIGEASGTAAALCAKQGITPRQLDPGELQRELLRCNALLSAEKIEELKNTKMPSGMTAEEFYTNQSSISSGINQWRKRWQEKGQL